jgi:hypothetical protein
VLYAEAATVEVEWWQNARWKLEESTNEIGIIKWQDLPDAEERLRQLKARDEELSMISTSAQYESRIESLEREIELLRAMQETWISRELNRPPLTRRQLIRMLLKQS